MTRKHNDERKVVPWKPLWKMDDKGVETLLGIDDGKLSRGVINYATGMFEDNFGGGDETFSPTKSQREKYKEEAIEFLTDLAITGTDNTKKAIADRIKSGGSRFRRSWLFDAENDCKLLRTIRDHSNDDSTLRIVKEAMQFCWDD